MTYTYVLTCVKLRLFFSEFAILFMNNYMSLIPCTRGMCNYVFIMMNNIITYFWLEYEKKYVDVSDQAGLNGGPLIQNSHVLSYFVQL